METAENRFLTPTPTLATPAPIHVRTAHDVRSDKRRDHAARVALTARAYERHNAVIVMATRCETMSMPPPEAACVRV